MARSVKEWVGKTDDSHAPPRVRLRVFDANNGMCHICDLPIKLNESWHLDHVKALIEGGENREANLKPAHAHCNLAKANEEKARKAKVAAMRQKHIGATAPKQTIVGKGFPKSPKSQNRVPKPEFNLPRRQLYREV